MVQSLHLLLNAQDEDVPDRAIVGRLRRIDTAARHWPDASRVFLADGDVLVLPTDDLAAILDRLAAPPSPWSLPDPTGHVEKADLRLLTRVEGPRRPLTRNQPERIIPAEAQSKRSPVSALPVRNPAGFKSERCPPSRREKRPASSKTAGGAGGTNCSFVGEDCDEFRDRYAHAL